MCLVCHAVVFMYSSLTQSLDVIITKKTIVCSGGHAGNFAKHFNNFVERNSFDWSFLKTTSRRSLS